MFGPAQRVDELEARHRWHHGVDDHEIEALVLELDERVSGVGEHPSAPAAHGAEGQLQELSRRRIVVDGEGLAERYRPLWLLEGRGVIGFGSTKGNDELTRCEHELAGIVAFSCEGLHALGVLSKTHMAVRARRPSKSVCEPADSVLRVGFSLIELFEGLVELGGPPREALFHFFSKSQEVLLERCHLAVVGHKSIL